MTSLYEIKTSIDPELKGHVSISRAHVRSFLDNCLDIVYPGNVRKVFYSEDELQIYEKENCQLLTAILENLDINKEEIEKEVCDFKKYSCEIAELIHLDATALYLGDPSAGSLTEVILTYPGLEAIAGYRIAHFFYQKKVPVLPRAISEIIHGRTGIDIHPGAQIGKSFFIDHGTGVVIGETAIIGNNVKLYQGVTLGALSVDKSLAQKKRHPTISDNCVVYSNATILGGDTVIGANSVIGGNVWITKSIPENSIVYHKSEVRLNNAHNINQEEELTYEI